MVKTIKNGVTDRIPLCPSECYSSREEIEKAMDNK